ncbi:MAG TPA: PhnD/SsuA/transferrin family substrate-binding protein [Opitutaceae bacterium]|nr:PhnD/SsuA/transferrin family substrate-binding protein [Opitutaceae bacterium]
MKSVRARLDAPRVPRAWTIPTVIALACLAFGAAEPVPPLPESVLRLGIPRQAFADLNENDASAAYRAFVISLGRRRGYDVRPDVLIFDAIPQLETAVRDGRVNVAILGTWQLLESRLRNCTDVAFVPAAGHVVARRVVLLVRRDSGLRALRDLRGKSVLVLVDTHTTLGRPWFETRCLAEGLGRPDAYVHKVDAVGRPNAAILPVFFGRADACIVDDQTFSTACELNPQLARDLIVIEQSEPMVDSVLCLNRTGWVSRQRRDDLCQSILELHAEPSGRQILMLFRFDRLVPIEPGMLDSVMALHARYARLVGAPASATVVPPLSPAVTSGRAGALGIVARPERSAGTLPWGGRRP